MLDTVHALMCLWVTNDCHLQRLSAITLRLSSMQSRRLSAACAGQGAVAASVATAAAASATGGDAAIHLMEASVLAAQQHRTMLDNM